MIIYTTLPSCFTRLSKRLYHFESLVINSSNLLQTLKIHKSQQRRCRQGPSQTASATAVINACLVAGPPQPPPQGDSNVLPRDSTHKSVLATAQTQRLEISGNTRSQLQEHSIVFSATLSICLCPPR